jgi:sensor histidine kinase YesM
MLLLAAIKVLWGNYVPARIVISLKLIGILASTVSFYTGYSYLFPQFLAKQKVKQTILLVLSIVIVVALIATFCFASVLPHFNISAFVVTITCFSVFSLLNIISGCFIAGFIRWYNDIRYKQELERKNLQVELALLKARINPHFLFNTLNNIDVLIEKDPAKASRYLKKLSDILRFMLYENIAETIPLIKELEYIEKYIELQRIRTNNSDFVKFEVKGEANNLKVAPMIFIPFIENAFKHTTNKKVENAIDLSIKIEGKKVFFSCLNFFERSEVITANGNGLGNGLIRNRLDLLYKNKYHLDIRKSEDSFVVNLILTLSDH